MAHDETNQPKSIEEALKLDTELQSPPDPEALAIPTSSTDEIPLEMTEEELTQQALAEANSERLFPNLEPHDPETEQPKTLLEAIHETQQDLKHFPTPMDPKPTIIPASNVENQPATQISIAELPGVKENLNEIGNTSCDVELAALKSFVDSHITHRMVNSVIQVICSSPSVSPLPTLWGIPRGFDFSEVVTGIVKDLRFLENIWPHLKIMMGQSYGNTAWAASVAITMAFFEGVKLLPGIDLFLRLQQSTQLQLKK